MYEYETKKQKLMNIKTFVDNFVLVRKFIDHTFIFIFIFARFANMNSISLIFAYKLKTSFA
jgi:hypothetical protein